MSLLAVLFRFREKRISICGDIREMYHQIVTRKEDQHVQRFLWRDDPNKPPDTYVLQVMSFGATCSPSSAQYVKNKHALNFATQYPRAVKGIIDNHYVDDYLDSFDTVSEAINIGQQVKAIHTGAGFEIRNWVSNSSEVVQALGSDVNNHRKNLNLSQEIPTEKVLGMWWCTESDSFTFSLVHNQAVKEFLHHERRPTKREILRLLMSIFDPIGLLANFLIYAKILLQDIWRSSINWDDEINDQQFESWTIWIKLLPQVEHLKIPRCYPADSPNAEQKVELHMFVDASEKAYAAVAYSRTCDNGRTDCTLIGAKTRVAPLKIVSIPRLELEAAKLGARFATTIQEHHSIKFSRVHFWSDSKTVICWLRSDHRRYKQFVAFRVGEILETTDANQWHWLPTHLNVADEATKWRKCPELDITSRWFNGPEFLRQPETEWPVKTPTEIVTSEELRPHCHHNNILPANRPNIERISNWVRLLRSHAYVFRYVDNLRAAANQITSKRNGPLSQEELIKAENMLYRLAQREGYPDEVALLMRNADRSDSITRTNISKNSSIYKQLPYLDANGIMRGRGRIDGAIGIPYEAKRPILLPREHHVTRLVVRHFHHKYHHRNNETVINEIRQHVNIPQVRAALKKEVRVCQTCKIRTAKPIPPEMADLPSARLASMCRPFSYVGIDYFGPMMVAIGRRQEKRWGMLVTCLTIRAIHIEIAHSLSTDSLANLEIYSDNGTNFRGADKELTANMRGVDYNTLMEEFTTPTTKWLFNPSLSPHMGGSWERLVRSVKSILSGITHTRTPSDELLRSMLLEAESIVNSRPLTHVPVDDESDEALTPNHFILGSSQGSKPICTIDDDRKILRKNWLASQQFANRFWKRWLTEYLPIITRRTKWFHPAKPITVGVIVIITDPNSPRSCWPKGRVLRVHASKDGQVRKATVQTSSGIYDRPAVKLAVLDVGTEDVVSREEVVIPGGSVTDTNRPIQAMKVNIVVL